MLIIKHINHGACQFLRPVGLFLTVKNCWFGVQTTNQRKKLMNTNKGFLILNVA